MRATYLAMALPIALFGCSQFSSGTSKLEEEARNMLEFSLSDAASARLRDVREATIQIGDGELIVCGLVNAKNQMGAYAGWRRFFFQHGAKAAMISPDANDESSRDEQAGQAVFESIYSGIGCPSTAYSPTAGIKGAVSAIVADRKRKR